MTFVASRPPTSSMGPSALKLLTREVITSSRFSTARTLAAGDVLSQWRDRPVGASREDTA